MYNIEKQHKKGKFHAIERINMLLDKGSFREINSDMGSLFSENNEIPYDGVIIGYGYISNKLVYLYAQDFTVCGGTVGLNHAKKIAYVIELALKHKCPIIGIHDSGGARIQEGINALAGYGMVFSQNVEASGKIPQIALIYGSCAGGAVYSPALMDFVFMVKGISHMYITGPKVVKQVIGEQCNEEMLGGCDTQGKKNGVAHFVHSSEKKSIEAAKKLIKKLPSYCNDIQIMNTRYIEKDQYGIEDILPLSSRKVYDMKLILKLILDENSFIEVHKSFAQNCIVGFGEISKNLVGIVANQPLISVGSIDCDASRKISQFVEFCNSFKIPLVTLVDTPGFLPGISQETQGIIREGARIIKAYAMANTIKITIIIRKAFGGAYIAMGSKYLNSDCNYVWPRAQIAVMGAQGASEIIYKKAIADMDEEKRNLFLIEKEQEYSLKYMNANEALRMGYVNKKISPQDTRKIIFEDIIRLKRKFIN